MEERIARVEGILEEVRNRLNHMEDRFEDRFIRLENDIKVNFRWTVGIMITMWVTIILAVLLR